MEQFDPSAVIVCWDSGRSEFRQRTFTDYKGNRRHSWDDPEFVSVMIQIKEIRGVLDHLNVVQVDNPLTEADDIIGLICNEIKGEKIVASSDQDMLQLVSGDTSVWSPIKLTLYTERNFKKEVDGLSPRQYLEMRALTGDRSDNIPGVARGFGETTACEVLKKYNSIEKLYSSTVEKKLVNKGNRYALLYEEGARDRAYRNLLIMDLSICGHHIKGRDQLILRIKQSLANRRKIDKNLVMKLLEEKDFKSMLKEFAVWIDPFENLDWRKE